MPSFFEGLKRLVSGQPVFQPGEGADGVTHKSDEIAAQQNSTEPVDADVVHHSGGVKIIPEVYINRVEYRNNGDNMEVDVSVKNSSQQEIYVDKLMILGNTRQIDYILRPGESRELPVFNGPRPNHRNYTNCELQYRDQATGDYFSSLHIVEFEQEIDKTYVISKIRFTPPIKDI